jgi:uncharacterized membrane protein
MPGGKLPTRMPPRDKSRLRPEPRGVIDLVVIGFDDASAAERVLAELQNRSMTFEDAVIARRNGNGRPQLKRDLTSGSPVNLQGAMWGSLVALPLLNSLAGFSIGAALNPGGQARSDRRIRDDVVRSIAGILQPNTSALAILMRNTEPAKLLAELPLHVRGWVIRSSYAPEQEARLNAALSGDKTPTQSASGHA